MIVNPVNGIHLTLVDDIESLYSITPSSIVLKVTVQPVPAKIHDAS